LLGTLLMGLAFSLTAFACVGPFVGTLLAGSVSGGGIRPLAGMAAFASGLALPFFGLALFPSWLGRLPKSGGWMARVKIVLGFVILAAALKYASNVDAVMQWNVLTRERFLAAWVVLFVLPGLYLLGFLKLEGVRAGEKLGIWRMVIGSFFIAFALSLIPGMFGGKLGEIDAYVPLAPRHTSAWTKNEYREALARGRAEGKKILLNFTGYACTNCHWMKANMFPRPEIAEALGNFVLVELYTDGTDSASEQNAKLLAEKFSTAAIPYYAIVDADEKVVATFPGLTRNAAEFLRFLRTGERAGSRLARPTPVL
jgi:thiol:disulfide interchange protein DsbD